MEKKLYKDAVDLLKQLISTPSFSKEENDTVMPNKGYTMDPFSPIEKEGKLYGLGSNDAGGCLVSLIATFLHFYDRTNVNHNVVFAASAEEEISGVNGIELV